MIRTVEPAATRMLIGRIMVKKVMVVFLPSQVSIAFGLIAIV